MRPAPWIDDGIAHLSSDPIMGPLVRDFRRPELYLADCIYTRIGTSIVYQQISTKAGDAIFSRFVGLWPDQPFPTPEQLAECTIEQLREIGLSRQKASYLIDLAAKCRDRVVRIEDIPSMDEAELAQHLTQIKGIGLWTVDMLMIFGLGRPDILPLGDLGIRTAFARLTDRTDLKPADMHEIAEPWRPYRSAATWYLWRLLEAK